MLRQGIWVLKKSERARLVEKRQLPGCSGSRLKPSRDPNGEKGVSSRLLCGLAIDSVGVFAIESRNRA